MTWVASVRGELIEGAVDRGGTCPIIIGERVASHGAATAATAAVRRNAVRAPVYAAFGGPNWLFPPLTDL